MKYLISFTVLFCILILSAASLQAQASLQWNKYDFVPGDKIILRITRKMNRTENFHPNGIFLKAEALKMLHSVKIM